MNFTEKSVAWAAENLTDGEHILLGVVTPGSPNDTVYGRNQVCT